MKKHELKESQKIVAEYTAKVRMILIVYLCKVFIVRLLMIQTWTWTM